ncbi:sugar phosphate isomerase/epimerase family protein [Pseudolysinimonas sp.]|uniref:sugar phosphate isomerase/epimerase family protein n=1 Tax=Pseudolysinimonas sp. TaxID=2680009 RepID=UPI003F819A06
MTVQWTLSGFGDEIDADPHVQLAVLAALGATHLELRSAWRVNAIDLDEERSAELRRIIDGGGMRVSAIASPVGKVVVSVAVDDELDRLRRAIAAAHRFDAPYIRLFSFWPEGFGGEGGGPLLTGALADDVAAGMRDRVLERMRAFADLAEREGVTLVHENEKDIYGDVPERVLDIIESVGSERLRVAWDNANYVQVGVAPYDRAYPLLREHLEYLQVKDARSSDGVVVPSGEGDGQLAATIAALRDDGYAGFASLEPHLASYGIDTGSDGPFQFGRAARAFRALTDGAGVVLA